MRKLLLPILLGMFLGTGAAQVVTQGAQYVFVAPSGVCLSTNPIQVLTITGEIYTCQNVTNSVGTWAKATSGGGGGTGTVTSVALTAPTGFSVAGSPVTTSGTLAVTTTGLTTNTILKAVSGGIGNGSITGDDGTHSPNSPNGLDMGTLGSLANQIANNAATGTTVNRLACDDGTGKVIICPHGTSTTNQPIGTVTNGAGTTGSATVAFIGFITVCFDNQSTAKDYAVGSTTTDGCLHDTGSTTLTAGQPNYFVWTANSGALTNGVYRLLTADDFSAAGCTNTCVTAAAVLTSNAIVLGAGTRAVKVAAGITTNGTSVINLGTDNSVAGSIQLSNSAANAHNIFASGATTTNTIAGFTVVPTTGHVVTCTSSGTVCTLTDGGALTSGTVTSIATTSPITGGTITATGTIACATCVTSASSLTNHAPVIGTGSQGSKTIAAGTSGQVFVSQGASTDATYIDFPDVHIVPAANCNNATAGNGWSIGSGGTVTCRAGTNNLGGYVSITDTASTFATFQIAIPEDWDTSSNPYIRFQLASTDATNNHTIIPSIQVACYKGDGTTTDDVAANAAHSLSTTTLNGNANRFWSGSNVQMNSTDVTGCVAGALMQITVGRATDTATNAEFYSATITFPRLLVVQAN